VILDDHHVAFAAADAVGERAGLSDWRGFDVPLRPELVSPAIVDALRDEST